MQRVKLSLACLLCLSWVTSASAQVELENDSGIATLQDFSGGVSVGGGAFFNIQHLSGGGVGYTNGYTNLGAFLPYWVNDDLMVAPNGRIFFTNNDNVGGSIGGVVRRYSSTYDRIFGFNIYGDFEQTFEGYNYSQLGFGFESLGQYFDMRSNVYLPEQNDGNFVRAVSLGNTPFYGGNNIFFNGVGEFQEALRGADFEVGAPITQKAQWLRAYAGVYAYEATGADPIGARARLEANISDDFTIGVNVTDDNRFGTNVNAVVDFRFSGFKPTRYFPNWSTYDRMLANVQRNGRISTASFNRNVPVQAFNPGTGNPYFVVWVDNSNPLPGNGTYENPYQDFQPSQPYPGADLILVRRGNSDVVPLNGPVQLFDNQRLLGEGREHNFAANAQFQQLALSGTFLLPEFVNSGLYPTITAPGDNIILANNNEVSAFNLINAGGAAITNDPVVGSRDFNLNYLNISNNQRGIFLQNASGIGVVNNVNALDNVFGGIQIANNSALELIIQDTTSNGTLPASQDVGIELSATNAPLRVTMNNVSTIGNTTGTRINGLNSDVVAIFNTVNASSNFGAGFQANIDGGSFAMAANSLNASGNAQDNVNILLVNGADMDLIFSTVDASGSVTGNGIVVTNSGGTGTAFFDNVNAGGNALNGLTFSGDNGAFIQGKATGNTFLGSNGQNGLLITANNGSTVTFTDDLTINNNGANGIMFMATANSFIGLDLANLNVDNNAGSGIFGVNFDSTVFANFNNISARNSGADGLFLLSSNGINQIRVNNGVFSNSGSIVPNSAGMNILGLNGSLVQLDVFGNSQLNNDGVNPSTQTDGLRIYSNFGSLVSANLDNVDLTSNLDNAVDATVEANGRALVNLVNSNASFSGFDGVRLTGLSGGQLRFIADSSPIDFSGAHGIDAFVRSDADVAVDVKNGSTVLFSGQNGLKVDAADAGTTFVAQINDSNLSESGFNLGGINTQDAIHVRGANGAQIGINLVNTPTTNFVLNSQQRGLFAALTTGAVFNFNNTNGDMSINQLNAMAVSVANPGSVANLNIVGTPMNGSGETGFLWNASDSGVLNATIRNSSLDSSGANGIQGSGIFGVATTGSMVDLSLTNTPVTNALDDAVFVVGTDLGTTVNAVFDASPLDNAGQNALDLRFFNGAAGIFTLRNGSTATNAGLDGAFLVADGVAGGVNTSLTVNAFNSDFSDSGQVAPANGINATTSLNANMLLNFVNTPVTNTTGTSPQLRGLLFSVQTGGNFEANFFNSNLSNHGLEGINGTISDFDVTDSRAFIRLNNTPVDGNGLNGALFNVTNRGDLVVIAENGTSFSNNGATGIQVNVDGALSTAALVLDTVAVDGNGAQVGGDGLNIVATNAASFTTLAIDSSFSNNANGGIELLTTTAAGGFTRFLNATVNNNQEEGLRAEADTGSTLRTIFIDGSLSDNGLAGGFNNVTVISTQASTVESYFENITADNATLNGFSFDVNSGSILIGQLVNGVTADNNANGNGVRFVARDAFTQAVLYMDGANTFDSNGTAVSGTALNPQSGAGVFFDADGVDRAGIRFAGGANQNGNPAEPLASRDVDGDGDGDHDGVYINIRNTNLAAVELDGPGSVGSNVDDGVDIMITNVGTVGQITQPSQVTPPAVVIGSSGISISNLTVSGNSGSGISFVARDTNIPGPIVVDNNLVAQNTGGDGILIDLTNVTGTPDLFITNNQSGLNSDNGININLDNAAIGDLNIIGNSIGLTQGGAGFIGDTLPVIRPGFDTNTLARNDDGSTGAVAVGFNMNFFGTVFNQLFVNNNGNVTFNNPLGAFTPFPIVTNGIPIIAPFFADVDTRTNGAPTVYGIGTVAGRQAFGVTWDGVDYFSGDHGAQLNEFQLVIIERGDVAAGDFDFEFNYEQVTWETGNASGGTNGLGGSSARVGFSNGSTNSFEFAGSAVNGAFLDSGPAATSLVQNSLNSVNLGRYRFASRGGGIGGTSPNGGDGVRINATNGSDIANVNIDQNTIQDNGSHGVEILANNIDLGPIRVENNAITGNAGDGIRLVSPITTNDPLNVFVNTNTISDNGGVGVNLDLVAGGQSLNLQNNNNTIENNTGGPGVNIALANNADVTANFNANNINGNAAEGVNFAPGVNSQIFANFTNNTISNNTSHGIDIPQQAGGSFTSPNFYGNTINENGGLGVNLTVLNNGAMNWQMGANGVTANTFNNNIDAGVGIVMSGNATGNLVIRNSTFSNTANGANANFNGDGLSVIQQNSSTLTGGISTSNFIGNAGDGATFQVRGDNFVPVAQLNNFIVGGAYPAAGVPNNVFRGNGDDGIEFFRTSNGQINNAQVVNSLIEDNTGDGIVLTAANQNTADTYALTGNLIRRNNNGILLQAFFDADLDVDMTSNVIGGSFFDASPFVNALPPHVAGDANRGDGIQAREQINAAVDNRSIRGTWSLNTIINNQGDGIDIGAAMDGLVIGSTVDPTQGNLIQGNDRNGVLITGPGDVTIGFNAIVQNGTAGTLLTANETAGINVQAAPTSFVTINNNLISQNIGDGIQHGIPNFTNSGNALVIDQNDIMNNTGRGIDILNRGSNFLQTQITDNFVTENGLEAIYIVNTASTTQSQNVSSSTALLRDGAIGASPIIEAQIAGNTVVGNGLNSGLSGTGLVTRIGTSDGGFGTNFAGGFASTGGAIAVGSGPFGQSTGFGGVTMTVDNNAFGGNAGNDVLFHSFVSTVDPGTGTDWNTDPANAAFNTAGYQSDPLSRFDLYFRNNTTDAFSVDTVGTSLGGFGSRNQLLVAFYNNADAEFKSRDQSHTGADLDGPFNNAGRARNATRQAARIPFFTAPASAIGASYLYPGMGDSTWRISADTLIDPQNLIDQNFVQGFNVDFPSPITNTNDANGFFLNGIGANGEQPFGWGVFP